jgi:peptide deformylase
MALRKLRYDDENILRKRSREITEIDDKTVQLLDDMRETLESIDGFGLAAPQVGILKRAIIMLYSGEEDEDDDEDDKRRKRKNRKHKKEEPEVEPELYEFINPVIIGQTGIQTKEEACLSVPGKSGMVERPEFVTVRAADRFGAEFEKTFDGLRARGLCHEIDHLDGVLYIDKATDIKNKQTRKSKRKKK